MKPSLPSYVNAAELSYQALEEAETIPALWYTDPEFLKLENQTIFKSTWQYFGSYEQIKEIGSYITGEITDVPLVVVHGQDKKIRCFANVCRHRGGMLATKNGHGRLLRCHYHGWTYGLDGRLVGTPHFDDKKSLKADQCQLPEYETSLWEGQIYVNLARSPAPFLESFAGIAERMLPMKMTQKFFKRIIYPVKANWKVYVDNYLEGYHVPLVHPELSSVIDNNQYIYELSENYSLQHSPITRKDNPYSTEGQAYYFWVFPNIMLNIMPGRVQVNSVIPTAHDQCHVYFDYYLSECGSTDLDTRAKIDIEFSELVQKQDADICEAVQRGLNSGTYHKGRIVPSQEMAVHHFQNLLKKYFRNFL